MAMLLRTIRRSIALKLTLTLIGFVAISGAVAGLYLSRALQAFAVESLETRLGAGGGVAHRGSAAQARLRAVAGGAHGVAPPRAPGRAPASMPELVGRIAPPTGARVTLIAPD